MSNHPPARIPCGEPFPFFDAIKCGDEFRGQIVHCQGCTRALIECGIKHINKPPSDPAKHAEVVREARNLLHLEWRDMPCGHPKERQFMASCKALLAAAAYLDSLPGDDNEPATVEWLEGIGIPHLSQFSGKGAYYFMPLQLRVSFESVDGTATLITPTRSQVRHLLAALTPAIGGE